jgi:ferredoxin
MTVARRNPAPSGAWHVRVDRARCQGHARCVALAPEIFEADALGNGRAIGDGVVAPALVGKLRLAAANCPEHAITVAEG